MKKHFYYYYTNRHALNSDYIPVMANCQMEMKKFYYLPFKSIYLLQFLLIDLNEIKFRE